MKRKPIPIQIQKDEEIHNFESMSSCAKFLGCQKGQLVMHPTYKGWKITILGPRTKMNDLKRKVFMFHESGELIREFESVHDCSRFIGVRAKNLIRYIQRGKYKNYLLSYSKENFHSNDYV